MSVQTISISNCIFRNNTNGLPWPQNTTGKSGGAIYVHDSTLTLTGNIFQGNSADNGGVLCADTNSTLFLSENTFQNNSADYAGGVLNAYTNNTLSLSKNTFQNNSAFFGGALCANTNNILTLLENDFQNNSANIFRSIRSAFAYYTVNLRENNTFQNNFAKVIGGSLVLGTNNTLTLSKNTFQNNSADSNGGALYAHTSNTLILSENIFQNNSAVNGGGALFIDTSNTFTLSENTFQNNSAFFGGALCADTNNTLTLSENKFQNNSAVYAGGVLYAYIDNTLSLSENTFQNNSAHHAGGVLYAFTNNTLTLTENIFQNNSVDYAGGALYTWINNTLILLENIFQNISADYGGVLDAYINNTLTLSGNIFQNNSADYAGGVINVSTNNTLSLSENTFQNNSAHRAGGVLYAFTNNTLTLTENIFQNNSVDYAGGALYTWINNTLILLENIFQNISADYGGVLDAYINNTLTLSGNIFQNNSADYAGGVINVSTNNTLSLSENTFQNNSAHRAGGVLYAFTNNTLTLTENIFQNNSVDYAGGALYTWINNTLILLENIFQNISADYGGVLDAYINNTLTLSGNIFQNNSADYAGGVINVSTNNTLTLSENTFQNNSAKYVGGAINIYIHNTVTISENTFQNNAADDSGGALYTSMNNILNLSQNTFDDNSAGFGGGALLVRQSSINLYNNNLTRNAARLYGGAIFCFSNSTLEILGYHKLKHNIAQYGGGIAALESQVTLAGDLLIENNNASFGGGLYVDQSQVNVSGHAHFSSNFANSDGGGIYSSGSSLYFKQHITFIKNSALNGGGLLFTEGSTLHLRSNTTIDFRNNFAEKKGGAIKVEQSNPLSYCVGVSCKFLMENGCFFQIETQRQYDIETNISKIIELNNVKIYFQNNTALEAGAALYGGSIDHCSIHFINSRPPKSDNLLDKIVHHCPNSGEVFDYITSSDQQTLDISSDPLYICLCEGGKIDCSTSSITRSVYPGGTIEVPVIAYGQRNGTTPAVIHITPGSKIDLENIQNVKNSCTLLTYTMQTSAVGTAQEITLYAEGSCALRENTVSSQQTNIITVNVSIHKCPPGFELLQFYQVCDCAQRLQRFTSTCSIEDREIERNREFWVGYVPNSVSDGLILHPHCPFDYCTVKKKYIAVNDSDEQCSNNRSGLLCGECGRNFSLLLGTNRCLQCSNDYLWLIAAFAFAGVALVLLLLVLRLTVAVGTINGLVFYANIFAINSAIFFRPQITNVLTVFIAWLNLDLGIESCFYNGMDAYTKAWLQFVFPVYVWALVGIIILISHYSSKVAILLGTNPIAVLATLFLLSYAKFLRTIITPLSYTLLEYSNNSQIAVWLYDGNISYLSNKHTPLFTVALVCLIVLFFPYTLFLIFSQWLRSKSGQWRMFHWVNYHRVLPFLDAYHAPYTDKHRYWTGLMLLVRCILFLLFAFNALGDPSVNLLAIGSVTIVLLIVYAIFGNRIYKTWYLNMLELSFIANLSILALATLYIRSTGGNQNAVTFTSISIAFAIFIGIVTCHSVQQIKHAPKLWRKMSARKDTYELVPQTDDYDLQSVSPPSPPDPSDGCATVTYINVRELLDLNNDIELREPCMEMVD